MKFPVTNFEINILAEEDDESVDGITYAVFSISEDSVFSDRDMLVRVPADYLSNMKYLSVLMTEPGIVYITSLYLTDANGLIKAYVPKHTSEEADLVSRPLPLRLERLVNETYHEKIEALPNNFNGEEGKYIDGIFEIVQPAALSVVATYFDISTSGWEFAEGNLKISDSSSGKVYYEGELMGIGHVFFPKGNLIKVNFTPKESMTMQKADLIRDSNTFPMEIQDDKSVVYEFIHDDHLKFTFNK